MSNLNPSQQAIVDATEGMVVVDAGPGTGKTHTIVERYVRIVSREDVSPKDVLMLTFTNNAAGEMEERIKDAMYEVESLKDEASLVQAGTFDSFCLSVVMDSPEQAGEIFGLKERITRGASIEQNETMNREWFGSFLDDFLSRRGEDYGQWAAIGSQRPVDLLHLIERLMARGLYPLRRGWFGMDPEAQLLGDRSAVLSYMKQANGASKRSVSKTLNDLQKKEPHPAPPLDEDGRIDEEFLVDAAYEGRTDLVRFIHDIYFEYVERNLASDRLTFGITSMLAFGLLYGDRGVRERNSYSYVMIDEFQDTNASQLMIALMILKRPNLCVVGDWKQGIYGFRFVSVENILDFESRIVSLRKFLNEDDVRVPFPIPEVVRLPLTVNYRSSSGIIDRAFACLTLKGSDDDRVDVEAVMERVQHLEQGRDDIGDDTQVRFVKALDKDDELNQVARCVRDYVGSGRYVVHDRGGPRPMDYGDIAVFCRTGNACADVLSYLEGEGIPAFLQGDVELMSTREGKLALAWLRFVNNVRDPWGYVPVMAYMGYTLVRIEEARNRTRDMPMELLRQRKVLYDKRRRPTDLLTTLFEFHGLDNDITQAIIAVLAEKHRGSLMTLSDLVRLMERDIQDGTRYPVENSVDSGAVRIMTMHKSKGLEFPAVIIPYVDSNSKPLPPRIRETFFFTERAGIRCSDEVHDFGGYQKMVKSWKTALVKGTAPLDYDEERRLMFVAMSRAQQYETLIGSSPSQFMKGLSAGSYCDIPEAGSVPTGMGTSVSDRPDVSGYPERPRRFGVHELMDFGTEDGTGGMSEASDEVSGKGKEYGTRVHEAAQTLFEGHEPSEDFPELGMIRGIVERAKGADLPMAEVDCTLPVEGTDAVLRGRIDLLVVDRDRIEVHDYKTDSTDRYLSEYEFQLSVYAWAARLYYGGRPVRCFVDYVSMGRTVEFDPLPMEAIRARVERKAGIRGSRRCSSQNIKIRCPRTRSMEGLTSQEVADRKARGLANDAEIRTSRTYTDIFVKNALTPFNVILFILGILLIVCDELISAVSATGIIIVNILISTIQEMRAKRKLDRISLLVRPRVTAVRDGQEVVIDQAEIVMDDLLVLRAGEQAIVDGIILGCRSLEMDESLLTGESSTVRKHEGDKVYSGSVCVTGEARYRVTAVGGDNYASQMLSSARRFTSKNTPLQMETGTITKILMLIAAVLFVATIIKSMFISHESFGETLEAFVLCLDVVPIALFLLITLTYMIAAARMADSGVLLQRSNSVESISHVDTVCMDKTGTITTNRLAFVSSEDLVDQALAARYASVFATLSGSRNRTMQAILDHYGEADAELVDEIQFSSERKYSAVRALDGDSEYTLYVGAWTSLRDHCVTDADIESIIHRESSNGFRTVLLCLGGDGDLLDPDGNPRIMDGLRPVSIISIRDEVRPDCRETIEVFLQNGMDLKVISGDDPVTVDALFSIADIPGERRIVSGPELEAMDHETFERTCLEANIFGRMKPENKEAVISALKRNGRYVAMIGDGVNDVKSLKTAQVGVALESGSGAARGVADMVLVKDNFSALPKALVEGRRTVSGMRDILKIYLTRNIVLAILMVAIYLIVGFLPMVPIQNTYYAFVSVTIMAFFMTLFAKPDNNKELILPDVLKFSVPSAIMIASFGLLVYGVAWWATASGHLVIDFDYLASIGNVPGVSNGDELIAYLSWNGSPVEEIVARSAMLFFISTAGILQMLLVSPRYRFLSYDGRTNRSLIPIGLIAFVFLIIYAMYAYFPQIAIDLVQMVIFPIEVFVVLIAVVVVWFFAELFVLKKNVFRHAVDRFEAVYMQRLTDEYTEGDDFQEK